MLSTRRLLRTLAIAATLLVVSGSLDAPARAGDAPRAIDVIENDLVADDPAVRAKAATELTDRFPDGAVAVPMLVDLLDDEDAGVVAAAARAIDSMAVAGAGPLAAFCADDGAWKEEVLGDRLVELIRRQFALDSPTLELSFRRRKTASELPYQKAELAMAALISEVSDDPSLAWRCWVARDLHSAMNEKGDVRTLAAAAYAMQGSDALIRLGIAVPTESRRKTAASAAVALTKHGLDAGAWTGAQILLRLRCQDASAVGALTQLLTAPKKHLGASIMDGAGSARRRSQESACSGLAAVGPAASPAGPVLLDLAGRKETDPHVVRGCADALLQAGKEAELLALFARNPPTARLLASVLASRRRGAGVVVPFLIATLKASSTGDGLEDLAALGTAAEAAVPVIDALPPGQAPLMIRRAEAVLAISPTDARASLLLESAMRNPDKEIAQRALDVFARRAPAGPKLVETLRATCRGVAHDEPTLAAYGTTLGRCGPDAKSVVPDLTRELEDCERAASTTQMSPRRDLTIALGRIGPDAARANELLSGLRDGRDETIRVPAAQALRRIHAKK